ncbi:hypothetical protein ADK59_36795, partial [Streptomyces sp. XY332]
MGLLPGCGVMVAPGAGVPEDMTVGRVVGEAVGVRVGGGRGGGGGWGWRGRGGRGGGGPGRG